MGGRSPTSRRGGFGAVLEFIQAIHGATRRVALDTQVSTLLTIPLSCFLDCASNLHTVDLSPGFQKYCLHMIFGHDIFCLLFVALLQEKQLVMNRRSVFVCVCAVHVAVFVLTHSQTKERQVATFFQPIVAFQS